MSFIAKMLVAIGVAAAPMSVSAQPAGGVVAIASYEVPEFPSAVAVSGDGANVYVASSPNGGAVLTFRRDPATGRLTETQVQREGVNGVVGLNGAGGIVVSPDDQNVYVASFFEPGVAVFARDLTDGTLTFQQVLVGGVGGGVPGIAGAIGVVMSPDGKNVYVTGNSDDSVAVFSRDVSGMLTFVEAEKEGVGAVFGVKNPVGLHVSSDNKNVYVSGSGDDAVAVFQRDMGTGTLTFLEAQQRGVGGVDGLRGTTGVHVSPDGQYVYATGILDSSLTVFSRDGTTGALTFLQTKRANTGDVPFVGLAGAGAIATDPSGATVFVVATGFNSLDLLGRTPGGPLSFIEQEIDGFRGVTGMANPLDVTASPDGKDVYVAAHSVVAFRRVAVSCPSVPRTDCKVPFVGGKATLAEKRDPVGNKSTIMWHWKKGAATTGAEFGTPTTTTDSVVCVYDGSSPTQAIVRAVAPASGTCPKRACWKVTDSGGFKYADGQKTPDGIRALQLAPGLDGMAHIDASLGGANFDPPLLPLVPPVYVQFLNSAGTCWEAVYATPTVNTTTQFKSKAQ